MGEDTIKELEKEVMKMHIPFNEKAELFRIINEAYKAGLKKGEELSKTI